MLKGGGGEWDWEREEREEQDIINLYICSIIVSRI